MFFMARYLLLSMMRHTSSGLAWDRATGPELGPNVSECNEGLVNLSTQRQNPYFEDCRRFGSNPVGHRADKSREVLASRATVTASAFLGIHPVDITQTSESLFMRMAERIREGKPVSPDFDVAVKRHQ